MDLTVTRNDPVTQSSACIAVAVYGKRKLAPAASAIDTACKGLLKRVLKQGDHSGKAGSTVMLHAPEGVAAERILLVGFGPDKEVSPAAFRKAVAAAMSAINTSGARDASLFFSEVPVKDQDTGWAIQHCALLAEESQYIFDELKQKKNDQPPALKKVSLSLLDATASKALKIAAERGQAIARGMHLCRDLGNRPGNYCTPSDLARQAQALGRKHKSLTVKVLDEAAMEKLGMGSLLSVSRGSAEPARLITIEYQGAKNKNAKPVVLVGKGVTFDTGGISLKPGAAMDEMKYDMCGAASVIGTLQATAELGLPINVVGIIPSTENMPGSRATKPGDIVTSMSGQTIEILNTDAEGRLILCDALTYAERFKPDTIIDIATLTGACLIALGKHYCGVMGNHQALIDDLYRAGQDSGDVCWQLPLGDEYDQLLASNFADMANIGGRDAGTITAACFLGRFTRDYHWAHLDIAGTAWLSGAKKGATGRPVPLLMQYLLNRC